MLNSVKKLAIAMIVLGLLLLAGLIIHSLMTPKSDPVACQRARAFHLKHPTLQITTSDDLLCKG